MVSKQWTRRDVLGTGLGAAAGAALASSGVIGPAVAAAEDPFAGLDATAMAELVRKKEVSPLELTDAALARIEALNPTINAVVTRFADLSRDKAKGPLPDGPFKGVPFLIKDLDDYVGTRSTSGSRFLAENISQTTTPHIARCEQAGFVMVGKTNTPEFGLLGTTEPILFGATHNPWSVSRSPGGSSGGAAAAVASGMVPVAHATDGGGSIRIPASCCGVFGLKPSRGRMARGPMPEAIGLLSVEHCVSRTVRDSARLFAATELSGADAKLAPIGNVEGPAKDRLVIALSIPNIYGNEPDAEVRTAIEATAKLCTSLGHEVVDVRIPVDGDAFREHFMALWSSSAAGIVELVKSKKIDPEQVLEPWTLGLADYFALRPKDAVPKAFAYFTQLEAAFAKFFEDYDAYLTPVLKAPPLLLGQHDPSVEFDELFNSVIDYVSYTPVHNGAGTPAMSVPLGWSIEGLPIGSHFSAGVGKENVLFSLAYELEAAQPWANKHPPVSIFTTGN
jgi:amidase